MRDTEPPESSATPPDATDATTSDDEQEEQPRVSSLRPIPIGFSQRRLLNIVSIGLAAIVTLALAIHWLPDALPRQPNIQPTRTSQAFNAHLPPARGSGWKPIGPDSAGDIAFTSNGALGYVCSMDPLSSAVSVSIYDVHQNTWNALPTPATGGSCRVYVSPDAGGYVVLVVDECPNVGECSADLPASRLYDSYDGGETWEELHLPVVMNVYDVTWANSQMYLAIWGNLSGGSDAILSNAPSHLLVSQRDGSFAEVDAQQLIGRPMQFSNIELLSSGTTLYASLDGMSCASYCTIQVRSADDGAHWIVYSANYKGSPITLQAAQPFTHTLVGWAFLPTPGILVPLRSNDNGDYWQELPVFPTNPATGGAAMFVLPDDSVYAFCFANANSPDITYALRAGANTWRAIAPLPAGTPVTVQYDSGGRAVALWGRANIPTTATGLEYYPLTGNSP
ncbi:MAG TPA: hypothetical protein VH591_21705 [Ktedonobacterales bacterium]|jgi:hypothetical protein